MDDVVLCDSISPPVVCKFVLVCINENGSNMETCSDTMDTGFSFVLVMGSEWCEKNEETEEKNE